MDKSSKIPSHRYQKIRELGRNLAGGTITYLATDTATGETVVIKQFQFAQSGSDWSSFKAYEREISVLESLNHPGIPRHLNAFETRTGFCMVQEYKNAQSLSEKRQFTPQQVKRIAISILEILAYLQSRIPPVIHRDVKPENILVDEELNAYLVDFGFARIGGGEGAMSSVAAGTFGFMAPEQLYNQNLSNATDLYGLGATLICLLTGTKSTAINNLIDDVGRINFKQLATHLSLSVIDWLEKMVQPKQKERFSSANDALEALNKLDFNLVPEVKLSQSSLEFIAIKFDEKITKTIGISNSIGKTLLKGRWEVVSHPNDPPLKLSKHAWISFNPTSFQKNQIQCSVTVDTSKLLAEQTYSRQILLQTNSDPATHSLAIEVHTGAINLIPKIRLASLAISTLIASILSLSVIYYLLALYARQSSNTPNYVNLTRNFTKVIVYNVIPIVVVILWFALAFAMCFYFRGTVSTVIATAGSVMLPMIVWSLTNWIYPYKIGPVSRQRGVSFEIGILIPILAIASSIGLGSLAVYLVNKHLNAGFSSKFSISLATLTTVLGISLGGGLILGFMNPFVLLLLIGSGLPLAGTINYIHQQRQTLIDNYCQSEQHRIKP